MSTPMSRYLTSLTMSYYISIPRSQVLETTGSHVATVWGSSLPVAITEELTLSSDCTEKVTVSLGRNGWAWLVSGRKLVIWRYRAEGERVQCRKLSLPHSNLAHRAELCLVYSRGEGSHTPCCLAVSPEGMVWYWPSITQESTSTEWAPCHHNRHPRPHLPNWVEPRLKAACCPVWPVGCFTCWRGGGGQNG